MPSLKSLVAPATIGALSALLVGGVIGVAAPLTSGAVAAAVAAAA
eukprot:SAG22_NODE_3628_length_1607_cov_0.947613_1_plen_44_part_10